jgi:rhodanese-related sulfurtransferase
MRKITADELKNKLDQDEDLVLINVLTEDAFEAEHIPGSHNVPYIRLDLVRKVETLAGRKDREIVVYCSNKQCQASPQAGRKLEESGFTKVSHLEGGMEEWKRAGYTVDSGAAAPLR